MAKRHEGKTVVISGAASGIGQASAVTAGGGGGADRHCRPRQSRADRAS